MKRGWRSPNLWIAFALLLANGLAWLRSGSANDWPTVEPRLDPQIATIRQDLWSGKAKGQSFQIDITGEMAAEAVAWFLDRHPEVPFSHPQVEIHPDGITGRGLAHVFGLRTPVYGRALIELRNGVPVVTLHELRVAGATAPGFVLAAIQTEVSKQLAGSKNLPVEITRLEFREGSLWVEGVYR